MENLVNTSLAKSTYCFQEQTKLLLALVEPRCSPPSSITVEEAEYLSLQMVMTEILTD